ncbi:hypothetical protein SF1_43180 [Sphingobacterium faecium NBRC 15299]|uniref:hypothetical protein n=1 Tax=Sphingobacterium faecium TaxID=34087 RepID=UPI000D34EDBA|nr:hypothetical protein [Sphingobacterium faecium]MQP29501.1 hypothetical protein [Sphingobacterium faecium]PTX09864.1 hypothetical protein C8N37_106495 [Sphingobacterium faecium]GEM66336.1 hypothetical protein SF1_43180 [Sphingobacterium faecium NBRC 15299]
MKDAVSIKVDGLPFEYKLPEVVRVSYDVPSLSIDVKSFDMDEDKATIKFNGIIGFRVLDEGNLLEFWNNKRPKGWLLEVVENGWFDLEKKREGFVTGYFEDKPKEYLILGINDCVSVLTLSTPIICNATPIK